MPSVVASPSDAESRLVTASASDSVTGWDWARDSDSVMGWVKDSDSAMDPIQDQVLLLMAWKLLYPFAALTRLFVYAVWQRRVPTVGRAATPARK